jgi:hypothetical protein
MPINPTLPSLTTHLPLPNRSLTAQHELFGTPAKITTPFHITTYKNRPEQDSFEVSAGDWPQNALR